MIVMRTILEKVLQTSTGAATKALRFVIELSENQTYPSSVLVDSQTSESTIDCR